ncbi:MULTISPECIES: hypothetical protein [Calothrix]|uniref:Uncharacterized protein n=2 Tax=Calothrix TaxID=1186 RepID=A0ABR8AJP9_9CYAN|nr:MULTISPECIES: hypothetical protein [Calothrix]MBD2200262.1 hypothetical protein [Calothrix parietina FACHB-288]MBD2229268.1 hypothetical protein [Calothrix anomala FACHB-343]
MPHAPFYVLFVSLIKFIFLTLRFHIYVVEWCFFLTDTNYLVSIFL